MDFHKTLKKIKSNMLSLFLAIAVSLTTLPYITEPIQVQAAEGNGTDDDSGDPTQTKAGWPSASKTGWLVYLVENKSDTVVSDVVALTCGGTPQGAMYLSTRIGNMLPSRTGGVVAWTPATPYDTSGSPNGTKIKNWMLKDDGRGTENWYNVVKLLWGEQKAIDMAANDYSLIMEPFYWANIGKGWVCANAKGWGQYLSATYGRENKGPSFTSRYTNGVFAHCAKFEFDKWGLTHYEGGSRLLNWEMEYYAVGIMSITPRTKYQTTCDEPLQPACHPAPSESTGSTTVIKNYRTKLPDNTYTDDGCFKTQNVSNKIIIEEEEEYKVVGWVTTNATTHPIDSINWNPPGVHIQEGKTSGDTVTLNPKTEKTLYVLLERKETEPEDLEKANYTITQSQITRGIRLSKPDAWLSMEKIQEFEFTWKSPKHKTKCDGHDYKTGDKVPELDPNTGDETGNLVDETDTAYCTWGKWVDQDVIFALDNSEKMNAPIRCYFFA